jgi:hypothetical protein
MIFTAKIGIIWTTGEFRSIEKDYCGARDFRNSADKNLSLYLDAISIPYR